MNTNLQARQPGRAESSRLEYPNSGQSSSPQPPTADAVSPKPIRTLVLKDMAQLAKPACERLVVQGFEMEVTHGTRRGHRDLVVGKPCLSFGTGGHRFVRRLRIRGCGSGPIRPGGHNHRRRICEVHRADLSRPGASDSFLILAEPLRSATSGTSGMPRYPSHQCRLFHGGWQLNLV